MTITVSYDRHDDLGFEVIVFNDLDSGESFQIQRELLVAVQDVEPTFVITTGVGAPVSRGISEWRIHNGSFEFALTARAARMCGGNQHLSFAAQPLEPDTTESITEHLERMLR